jgi:hypothetical protein
MLSNGLRLEQRTDVSEYLVKRCPECDHDFEVLLWTKKGMSKDKNRGWHKVVYCDTCSQERSRIRRTYAYRQRGKVKNDV